jgi:phenylpropionate dioxygenase-like ring-hydroxylating dioxygenase large terminal subunit
MSGTHPGDGYLPHQWFVACASRTLGAKPLACTIQGVPLVLFRDGAGRAGALLDRCPHRNVPLSAGRVADGLLECGYHGWRFDGDGACRLVPALLGDADRKARRAESYATAEHDGFVWVYSTPDATPIREPYRFPVVDRRYTTIRRDLVLPGPLRHALENALDVPHTAFLHGGLFRQATVRNEIQVTIRRDADGAYAEYAGEPRPSGLIGRLLAPGGGVVEHFDRFLLPSIAQVEYRLGPDNHLLNTTAMTPIGPFETRLWAVIQLRLRRGGGLVAPLVAPLAMRILRQDGTVLALQSAAIRRAGGEHFTSTEVDVLGPHIWKMLAAAETGEQPPPFEHRVTMRV